MHTLSQDLQNAAEHMLERADNGEGMSDRDMREMVLQLTRWAAQAAIMQRTSGFVPCVFTPMSACQ